MDPCMLRMSSPPRRVNLSTGLCERLENQILESGRVK
jgi:hypothetical protein